VARDNKIIIIIIIIIMNSKHCNKYLIYFMRCQVYIYLNWPQRYWNLIRKPEASNNTQNWMKTIWTFRTTRIMSVNAWPRNVELEDFIAW
jgi:hypothetical protein